MGKTNISSSTVTMVRVSSETSDSLPCGGGGRRREEAGPRFLLISYLTGGASASFLIAGEWTNVTAMRYQGAMIRLTDQTKGNRAVE